MKVSSLTSKFFVNVPTVALTNSDEKNAFCSSSLKIMFIEKKKQDVLASFFEKFSPTDSDFPLLSRISQFLIIALLENLLNQEQDAMISMATKKPQRLTI